MRLMALLVTATLSAPPAFAGPPERPSPPTQPSPPADSPQSSVESRQSTVESPQSAGQNPQKSDKQADDTGPTLNLPVSVNRIRQALELPAEPLKGLRGLDETPTFRVQIRERLKIDELLQSLDFKSGPPVPGGLYGYEQQRQLFPSVSNPLVQPYAAFNQGELLTILVENLVGKYLAGRAMQAISSAERAHAEAAARDEVTHAIAEYCAAQPNHGAGIQICTPSPSAR
jgi:hypothetical protein